MTSLHEFLSNSLTKQRLLDIGFNNELLANISVSENLNMPVDTWAASWLGIFPEAKHISTIQVYALVKWVADNIELADENWQRRSEIMKLFSESEDLIQKSNKNSVKAKADRITDKPTKQTLLKFKEDYVYKEGKEYGWQKAAVAEYGVSRSTITKTLK